MNLLQLVIRQPVTVAVGVILIVMAGLIALQRLPIDLTPHVEDTIVAVTTRWEGASPVEVEREIVEKQEEKLQGIANVRSMTSECEQGVGQVRLEFAIGTSKDAALREVSDKLREVPDYPQNVEEPVIEASDPDNRDFIAWMVLATTDPDLDVRTMKDFAEDRIKPAFERVDGMAQVNVLGGREREAQIRFNPVRLAQYGITPTELVGAIQQTNRNVSGGELADAKFNVRLRTVSQFESIEDVEDTVVAYTDAGPVYVRDVAQVVVTHKELVDFVRSKGKPVIAINAQKEVGANVIKIMDELKAVVRQLNTPGGVLDREARRRGLNGTLELTVVYDQTIYIDDALALVRNNIWLGGAIAIGVLLVFLRSVRSVAIIAAAIPISVIGAIVIMVAMGRTVNVISLAGMAFAVGMVVDNAIVVLENIFRHLELGKKPAQAAYDGVREVWGAILASTLTTVAVFIPILLVADEAGQLFRDISLAICAAVGLSLLVSISVIPTCAARLLQPIEGKPQGVVGVQKPGSRVMRLLTLPWRAAKRLGRTLHNLPDRIANLIYWICGSVLARLTVVIVLTGVSVAGTYFLLPPADYLPQGNRNIVFGLLLPPPGYNFRQQETLAKRIEGTIRPYWKVGDIEKGTDEYGERAADLPAVPTFDWMKQAPGDPVVPPPVGEYFVVSFDGVLFHGAVSEDSNRVVDLVPLFQQATRPEVVPGVFAFAFQLPLFQLGGSTGSAIKINLAGDDLDEVADSASALMKELVGRYGAFAVQPSPSNFNIFGPEIQVVPKKRRLADLGMTPADLGLASQANGDGAFIGEYRIGGDSIDLKLIAKDAVGREAILGLEDTPIATPTGHVVPMSSVAEFRYLTSPVQINHVERQRSVTLLFTPPQGMAIDEAVVQIGQLLDEFRADGRIPPEVATTFAGSASKLRSVKTALLGDGTILGTLNSSLVLALVVVYLLMCVLFQSFVYPLVIMFSVPLATLGGVLALFAVYRWSVSDRYLPMQMLDVLTMLGFVILIGVVVNNAILIVHQSINFMQGAGVASDGTTAQMPPRKAIAEAVRTRVRPIFMSTFTSVGAMAPLVLMPGAGSELYRGLGSVVVGGLLVSTVFTILLVPLLLSLVTDLQQFLDRVSKRTAVVVEFGVVPIGAGSSLESQTSKQTGPGTIDLSPSISGRSK